MHASRTEELPVAVKPIIALVFPDIMIERGQYTRV